VVRLGILAACAVLLALLGGCASPADRAAMEAGPVVRAQVPKGDSVQITVSGGQETGALDPSSIADADLKAAVEASILKAGLFGSVSRIPADYTLYVRIIELQRPLMGGNFTVKLELAWQLIRISDQKIMFRTSIRSSHRTTMSESFAAVTRLKMAVEGAVKENIETFLKELSAAQLPD
jgi:ABC-type uncharacterized transport system auxiliary subunit